MKETGINRSLAHASGSVGMFQSSRVARPSSFGAGSVSERAIREFKFQLRATASGARLQNPPGPLIVSILFSIPVIGVQRGAPEPCPEDSLVDISDNGDGASHKHFGPRRNPSEPENLEV